MSAPSHAPMAPTNIPTNIPNAVQREVPNNFNSSSGSLPPLSESLSLMEESRSGVSRGRIISYFTIFLLLAGSGYFAYDRLSLTISSSDIPVLLADTTCCSSITESGWRFRDFGSGSFGLQGGYKIDFP